MEKGSKELKEKEKDKMFSLPRNRCRNIPFI